MIKRLKTVNEQQLKEILAIWLASNIETHDYIERSYWEKNLPIVAQAIPEAEVYVYEEAGQILAFLGIVEDYIAGIFVTKACRGQAIGTQLIEQAKIDHSSLTLNVFKKNQRAIAFYQSLGFEWQQEQIDPETNEYEWMMVWHTPLVRD